MSELPSFPFPACVEWSYLDYELRQKMTLDQFLQHEGHIMELKGKQFVLHIRERGFPKDSLRVDITTDKYRCSDASHFYGGLLLPEIECTHKTDERRTIQGVEIPTFTRKIYLHRQLSARDIKKNPGRYSKDWEKEGAWTKGFNSTKDIVTRAEMITKEYFPGFKLVVPTEEEIYKAAIGWL